MRKCGASRMGCCVGFSFMRVRVLSCPKKRLLSLTGWSASRAGHLALQGERHLTRYLEGMILCQAVRISILSFPHHSTGDPSPVVAPLDPKDSRETLSPRKSGEPL